MILGQIFVTLQKANKALYVGIMTKEHKNPLKEDLCHILEHTGDIWDDLRDSRIFITGGTGFIGCWLLESFIWTNEKLGLNANAAVLTRNYETFHKKAPHLATNPAVKFYKGDVRNFEFPKGEFSHIIHASGQLKDDPLLSTFDSIVRGTKQVLDFALFCGAKKLLLTSSGVVYGKQPSDMAHISEEYNGAHDPANPNYDATYGIGKLSAEHLCALYSKQYGIETKIARCFSFVGPYLPLDIHYAIGNFIRDGLKGEPIKVKGDGTSCRSYMYAADLAIWLWTILIKGESCRPYNVGSEEEYTIAEVAEIVSGTFKDKPDVEIAKSQTGKPAERYVPSVQRAVSELGLKQFIGIEEAIMKTVNALRAMKQY